MNTSVLQATTKTALITGLSLIMAYSAVKLYAINSAMDTANIVNQNLADHVSINIQNTESTTSIASEQLDNKKFSTEEFPIAVDFDAITEQNSDIIAWLYSPDTPINYPIVQAPNNNYYLHHLVDGSYNSAGTLFADYRNASDLTDWTTIIYGHNMLDDSMFGSLLNYKNPDYYTAHPILYLQTPNNNYKVNVFAGCTIYCSSKIYNTSLDKTEKAALVKSCIENSDFISEYQLHASDKILILSTCNYDGTTDSRYVVLGALQDCSS